MSGAGQAADLGDLRILILHPQDAEGEQLARELRRLGCQVLTVWPRPDELPQFIDVVFVLLDPQSGFPQWLATQAAVAVIGIIGRDASAALRMLGNANAHAVIVKPVDRLALMASLILARNSFRYEKRLRAKNAKLEETLREFRKVEQAKLILMQQNNIGQQEAYDYLRKQAMDRRVSVMAIATTIVEASELLMGRRE